MACPGSNSTDQGFYAEYNQACFFGGTGHEEVASLESVCSRAYQRTCAFLCLGKAHAQGCVFLNVCREVLWSHSRCCRFRRYSACFSEPLAMPCRALGGSVPSCTHFLAMVCLADTVIKTCCAHPPCSYQHPRLLSSCACPRHQSLSCASLLCSFSTICDCTSEHLPQHGSSISAAAVGVLPG